jgi:hypothetical protein
MAQLDMVLNQFHADLRRAGHLLRLVKEFRQFAGSSVPDEVQNGTVPWTEAVELAGAAPHVRTDLPVLSGSLLLYICGRFEYFVREVVVALADEIAAKVDVYSDLPEPVRKELRTRTLDVALNPRRFGFTATEAEQLLVVLGKNLDSSGTVESVSISSRVLAVTDSNMNSRTLVDMFKRVARSDFWVDIGKQARLKAHLSASVDKECTQEAQSRLDTIMKERNGIAHPTSGTHFPDPDQVLSSAEFLKVLSEVIVDLARVPT